MIKVDIRRNHRGDIASFTMDGHADYAGKGQDIVCAGASAVAFGSINAVMALTGITPHIEQTDSGFLTCSLPDELSEEQAANVRILLEGMVVSLETIERDYGKYIQISTHR